MYFKKKIFYVGACVLKKLFNSFYLIVGLEVTKNSKHLLYVYRKGDSGNIP